MKRWKMLSIVMVFVAAIVFCGGEQTTVKASDGGIASYKQLMTKLGKQDQFRDGIYTAKVTANGSKLLLITDAVYKSEGQNAIWADVYQLLNDQYTYVTTIVTTGTAYPICKNGAYLLSGYHHKSLRYRISDGGGTVEQLNGLYLGKKYCTYTKYSLKDGKMSKVSSKKIKTKKAEKQDYYVNKKGNYRGTPIRFKRVEV